MTSLRVWGEEFYEIEQEISSAKEILEEVDRAASRDQLAEFGSIINRVDRIAKQIKARYFVDPVMKFRAGLALTREEFYILMAADFSDVPHFRYLPSAELGFNPDEPFEVFSIFHYSGSKRQGYINPEARRPPKFAEVRGGDVVHTLIEQFGVAPEEISVDELSPEQRAFFANRLPDLYKRFKRAR